jgi:hypothetical protein
LLKAKDVMIEERTEMERLKPMTIMMRLMAAMLTTAVTRFLNSSSCCCSDRRRRRHGWCGGMVVGRSHGRCDRSPLVTVPFVVGCVMH